MQRDPSVKLSINLSLGELTTTTNAALQAQNRDLTDQQVDKLAILARHGEAIRAICGSPVHVHSGYRCDKLNGSTAGSSKTSQHPSCEAMDFDVNGQPIHESFDKLMSAAKDGRFTFGQLILESADRGYKDAKGNEVVATWCHCSARDWHL